MTEQASPRVLPDQPDAHERTRKAIWRQVRAAVGAAVVEILPDVPGVPRVSLLDDDAALAAALAVDVDVEVRLVTADEPEPGPPRDHVVILPLSSPATAADRLAQMRAAVARLRPTGRIVLVATVVAGQGDPADTRAPSMSQLAEEVDLAMGGAVHLDRMQSLRWSGEPIHRGVVLLLTSLPPATDW